MTYTLKLASFWLVYSLCSQHRKHNLTLHLHAPPLQAHPAAALLGSSFNPSPSLTSCCSILRAPCPPAHSAPPPPPSSRPAPCRRWGTAQSRCLRLHSVPPMQHPRRSCHTCPSAGTPLEVQVEGTMQNVGGMGLPRPQHKAAENRHWHSCATGMTATRDAQARQKRVEGSLQQRCFLEQLQVLC